MKKRIVILATGLAFCLLAIAVIIIFQYDYRKCDAIRTDPLHVHSIRARVIANTELEIGTTDYFDVPIHYRELMLALISEPVPIRRSLYHPAPVCELIVGYEDGYEDHMTVVWLHGTGELLFQHGTCYYRRSHDNYPAFHDEGYLDEAATLSGLLWVIHTKDDERAAFYERILRRSVGLDQLPQPERMK